MSGWWWIGALSAFTIAGCGGHDVPAPGAGLSGFPYRTVIDTVGDTVVARTTGDVPVSLLRALVVEWKAGSIEDTAAILGNVTGLAVGADGRVAIWDPATPALWLYDANGRSPRRIGTRGAGPGEYTEMNGVTVLDDGRIVAASWRNGVMHVYAPDGSPQAPWKTPPRFPLALTHDITGRVWLLTSVRTSNGRPEGFRLVWIRFDPTGEVLDTVRVPESPTGDTALKATGPHAHIENDIPFGKYARFAASPLGFVVWGPGGPYVVHSEVNGRPLRIEREWTPVPIPDRERMQRHAWIETAMRSVDPGWTWSAHDIPLVKPPYDRLSVGLDGRIWVSLNVESEEFNPEKPRDRRIPVVQFRPKQPRWDVFEPDGRYLGRVVGPRDFTLYAMRGNAVWGVTRDADDVPTVVKMRVEPRF